MFWKRALFWAGSHSPLMKFWYVLTRLKTSANSDSVATFLSVNPPQVTLLAIGCSNYEHTSWHHSEDRTHACCLSVECAVMEQPPNEVRHFVLSHGENH